MSGQEPQVFFVVGRGRSGTTLLGRMLARHPAMDVAPEGFFIMNLLGRYGRGPWDRARIESFCRDLVLENRMRTWNLDVDRLQRRLEDRLPDLDFRGACHAVYGSYAGDTRGRTGVRMVGDKNPHYALFAGRLAREFPGARFVHITRDPRDNVQSYRKVPFDVNDVAALADRWCRYNRSVMAVARQHPDRFHRVAYEDLVSGPEAVLEGICQFLGLDFDPAMLSFHEDRPEGFYGEGSPWFEKLSGPLDAGQARKWESEMSEADIATVEAVAGSLMDELGYARSGRGRPPLGWRARSLFGWSTVVAERVLFGVVPANWRSWVINAHRARSGRT
jgi:hypothetical protein